MQVARRCADCGRPLVAVAEPVVEGAPRPRALLGVSVVVDYGPPGNGRAGGDLELCFACGGTAEIDRGLTMAGGAPAPKPAAKLSPAALAKAADQPAPAKGKAPGKVIPIRPRKQFT